MKNAVHDISSSLQHSIPILVSIVSSVLGLRDASDEWERRVAK